MAKSEEYLNKICKDVVTGFKGTCTAYAVYSTGCNQICLAPKVGKDGDILDSCWFDVERVEIISTAKKVASSKTGGPRHHGETAPCR